MRSWRACGRRAGRSRRGRPPSLISGSASCVAPRPLRRRRGSASRPAWGLAAAAVLVMAVAAAIANLDVSYGGELVVRTGWNRGGDVATAPGSGRTGRRAGRLERPGRRARSAAARARDHDCANRRRCAWRAARTSRKSRCCGACARCWVRAKRASSASSRLRLSQIETQRKLDLATIDQGMARLQNASGAEVRQYRESLQRVALAAYQQK